MWCAEVNNARCLGRVTKAGESNPRSQGLFGFGGGKGEMTAQTKRINRDLEL